MKIIYTKDYQDMSKKAAMHLMSEVVKNPKAVLGLATGSTPIGTYENLIKLYKEGFLSFADIKTVNLDEYKGLEKDNSQSYYYFMNHNLFKDIDIKPENTNIPDGTKKNADEECKRYEELIQKLGGVDIQLLGLGHNGHIGFNEPDDIFALETHCVSLTQSTIDANARFFSSKEEVPTQAYTMGIGTIMKAKKILIIVSGKDKADIVKEAFFGSVTPKVPASILQMHPDVTLIADEAALSKVLDKIK